MIKYTELPNSKQASSEDTEREANLRSQVEFQKKLAEEEKRKQSENKDAISSR